MKIAYILLHFPYPTETFVAEEIAALRTQGTNVQIVSLLGPGKGVVQPLSQRLLRHTWYAPGLWSPKLWIAQGFFLFQQPRQYAALLSRLIRQPYPKRFLPLLLKRLVIFLKAIATAYHLRTSSIQLLHAHFAWLPGAAAWIIARLLGLPFTVTVHAYDLYYSNDLLTLVIGEAERVIAISEYNREYVMAQGNCPREAVTVIHCGVNFAEIPARTTPRRRPPGEPLRILSVGSLVPKKGHAVLISACHHLKQKGYDFTCTIIGDGPQAASLRRQVREKGLQTYVNLLGPRPHPEVMEAYAHHDIFVLASIVTPTGDRDGIPVVLMEAGAAGLPLISTPISGIPELVRHGQTGWLVPSGDAKALAEAIERLAQDPDLRERLGDNARSLVESEFHLTENARRLLLLFQEVIQQHSTSQSPSFEIPG